VEEMEGMGVTDGVTLGVELTLLTATAVGVVLMVGDADLLAVLVGVGVPDGLTVVEHTLPMLE
jgi:hypothetical protein